MQDLASLHPLRVRFRNALLKKEISAGSVRITLHHHRAISEVRQQYRRNIRIILQQIALGDSLLPEELLEIGQLKFAPSHLDQCVVLVGRN